MSESREILMPPFVKPVPFEILTFDVLSRSRKEPWRVDLEGNGFNGECRCEDFICRHGPALREDAAQGKPALPHRCWHLNRAWEYAGALHARMLAIERRKMNGTKHS